MPGELTRKLSRLNDNGTAAVTIPKSIVENADAEFGDEVQIVDLDTDKGRITYEF